jgi:cysteine desulfurase
MRDEVGNASARNATGARAVEALREARQVISDVVSCEADEVVFTSGASESDNLALLGLEEYGRRNGLTHIVSTSIEHKAVLEPLEALRRRGFEIELVDPGQDGRIEAGRLLSAVREDTLVVSVMHVNNETGVLQPVAEVADGLAGHSAFLHVDAAQGFGKSVSPLRHSRLDLISVSSHKVNGPPGVGALIMRRRGGVRVPSTPIMLGGGQENGLRPGTVPVALCVGFGVAARLALRDHEGRLARCAKIREDAMKAFARVPYRLNGNPAFALPNVLNVSVEGVDAEAALIALKGVASVSTGSACTARSHDGSHVLKAMRLGDERIEGALRFSWCHLTPDPDWSTIVERIGSLLD